jgi:hypothetical protein
MLEARKIEPLRGVINGIVKGFTVPQHAKRRLRPIFEPLLNDSLKGDALVQLQYPSRYERRARAVGARFSAELDFAAYFDQFELAPACRSWFVLRLPVPLDGERLFALTRMPMGASFAPGVAQLTTWIIVHPLTRMAHVRVDSMIDNIRVLADTPGAFVIAMRTLLDRIRAAALTLNDAHLWAVDDTTLLQRCAIGPAPRLFLGEEYREVSIANSPANVEKLARAIDLYRQRADTAESQYSLRNFASLIGLIVFMGHTIDLRLCDSFTLLRAWGTMVSEATGWDGPCHITSAAVNDEIERLARAITANRPVSLAPLQPPSFDVASYGACVIVDASVSGMGAFVYFPDTQRAYVLRQRWTARLAHSAHAEPRAALIALRWARARVPGSCVAIVTDHAAIATGQRRWYSRNGGFSSSFHLNELYRALYGEGGGEVFFVDGDRNPADGPSRDTTAPLSMAAEEIEFVMPNLREFSHPHADIPRPPECV